MKILNYKIIKNENQKKSRTNDTLSSTKGRLRSESMSELNLNVKSSLIVIKKIKFRKSNLSFHPLPISLMNIKIVNEISFNLLSIKIQNELKESPRKFNSSSFPKNFYSFMKKEIESPRHFNKSSSIVFPKNYNNPSDLKNLHSLKSNQKSSIILLGKRNIEQFNNSKSPIKEIKEINKKKYSVKI